MKILNNSLYDIDVAKEYHSQYNLILQAIISLHILTFNVYIEGCINSLTYKFEFHINRLSNLIIPRPVTSSRFAEGPMIINLQTTPVYL